MKLCLLQIEISFGLFRETTKNDLPQCEIR